MNRVACAAAVAAMFFVGAASAASSESKPRDEGKICTLETVVGSHMPKRVCTTAAEREATRNAGQESMNRMKTMGRTSGLSSKN